ncbi:OsmC family protein [Sphingopyxis witflariensis]|uniref:OsmC family protein n=1 Tax=Sphingopyxis witflariensis TaxID=173675 RepID=UPI001F398CCB|nr:hypothetical protein [Sphingopyxis witflariensis]
MPISPPENPAGCLNHRNEGSLLDADHPANGVLFARRSTRMYADRKEWPLESLGVALRLHGKDERRIERILTIVGLDDAQKARLADVAERTPVTLTLKNGLPIDTHLA